MINNLIIRDAEFKDIKELAEIHIGTWQFAYKEIVPESYLKSLDIDSWIREWEKWLLKPASKTRHIVAEINKKIVGFCNVGKSRDKDVKDDIGEIYSIYLNKDYINEGIGTKLIKEGLKSLKNFGFNSAVLWVLKNNIKTRSFYQKMSFIPTNFTKTIIFDKVQLTEMKYEINLI